MFVCTLELGDDNDFIGFFRSRKQQPKDNPNGAFGFRCLDNQGGKLSLLDFVAMGHVPQNNGPLRPGGQGPIILGPSHGHKIKEGQFVNLCKKSMDFHQLKFVFAPMIPIDHLF